MSTKQSANLDSIQAWASKEGKQNTRISWSMVALNAITFPLVGGFLFDVENTNAKATTAIDDEWLATVAALPDVSKRGLAYLTRILNAKGWVSVEEAEQFVSIEQAERAAIERADQEAKDQSKPGAALLLARADRELPGFLSKLTSGAKDVSSAAFGVASFSKEVAVLTGKGLGAAAGWIRDVNG